MSAHSATQASSSSSATLSGARGARPSWLARLLFRVAAGELDAFVVPGAEVARARGLDLASAGLRPAATPRHASVLVVVGGLPGGLGEAAAVAYAQMPRPRSVLAVAAGDVSPLPGPDVSVGSSQDALVAGVARLRRLFAEGAFDPQAEGFEAAVLVCKTEYACPMHPGVVQDGPGTCPKCGMTLVPRAAGDAGGEAHAHHGSMDNGEHHSHGQGHGGMDPAEHRGTDHEEHARHGAEDEHPPSGHEKTGHHTGSEGNDEGHAYHDAGAEHSAADPGVSRHGRVGHDAADHDEEGNAHAGYGGGHGRGGHGGMDHGDVDHGGHGGMGFMSMVEMTQGTPRSSDGLQMEWVDAPFGPLFPGLPGGLALTFTLDGDAVAEAEAGSALNRDPEVLGGPVGAFVEQLAGLDPLSSVAYRLLALRAVEDAAGVEIDEALARARLVALERERAASHLNWLALFGHLIGYGWLARRAAELHLALLRADASGAAGILAGVRRLARRTERTPLLRRGLSGVGKLPGPRWATGPVARASGAPTDARAGEEAYRALGFEPVVAEGGDALARLRVRLAETEQSLVLAHGPPGISSPDSSLLAETVDGALGGVSGVGEATLETPRGAATLRVALEGNEVEGVRLAAPSAGHVRLVGAVAEGREVADALVGIASLDLSPWSLVWDAPGGTPR